MVNGWRYHQLGAAFLVVVWTLALCHLVLAVTVLHLCAFLVNLNDILRKALQVLGLLSTYLLSNLRANFEI